MNEPLNRIVNVQKEMLSIINRLEAMETCTLNGKGTVIEPYKLDGESETNDFSDVNSSLTGVSNFSTPTSAPVSSSTMYASV